MFGVDIDFFQTGLIILILVLMLIGHLHYSRQIRNLEKKQEDTEEKEDGIIASQWAIVNDLRRMSIDLGAQRLSIDACSEQLEARAASIEDDIRDLDRTYDKAISDINQNWQFLYPAHAA